MAYFLVHEELFQVLVKVLDGATEFMIDARTAPDTYFPPDLEEDVEKARGLLTKAQEEEKLRRTE